MRPKTHFFLYSTTATLLVNTLEVACAPSYIEVEGVVSHGWTCQRLGASV